QHYFMNAAPLAIPVGGTLSQWVYVPSDMLPAEIMLQFRGTDGSYDHRAYWSADASTNPIGLPGVYKGQIPLSNQWVELTVPAAEIGLSGQQVDGLSYMLYNGSL